MTKKGNKISRSLRYYYLRFKRLNDDPKALAGGTAIGVLVGLTPTVPLHTPLIILLTLSTKSSFLAAILVSWVVFNPLTLFPIYYFSLLIGNHLTPYEVNFEKVRVLITGSDLGLDYYLTFKQLVALGYEAIVVLFVGGFVFSLPFAIVSYYCALSFFINRRRKRQL